FCVNGSAIEGCSYSEQPAQTDAPQGSSSDAVTPEVVRAWLGQGELPSLAQAWVRRVDIDWMAMHPMHGKPMRVSLPTYPFARERFWVTRERAADASQCEQALVAPVTTHLHP